MSKFIGRKKELEQLALLFKKNSASLVVLKGRRRIGKSRLIQEFGKNIKTYLFSGIPPTEKTTAEDQLSEFGWQLGKSLGQPAFIDQTWNDLFLRLAAHTRKGKVLICLDEISWMGSKDPNFLGKLKNAWDLEFKQNPNLILILCGSVSSWIEKNILSSTGFVGRISLSMTLEELPLSDCNKFWPESLHISAYEKYKILSITGGVPKYLEEIHTELSAEENIKNLCFNKTGFLFNEFEHIFADVFSSRSEIYKKIVQRISDGSYEYREIYKELGIEKNGIISQYLDELSKSGFIRRDYTWHIKTGKQSKLSRYRISDNYLRFYLKYVLPNKEKIERNDYINRSITSLPAWDSVMGLQFENFVLSNRHRIQEILGLKPEDVIYDNPFFQRTTSQQYGCQIDYLIQTRFNTLYICEIKFSRHPIKYDVINELKEKIKSIKIPKYFSVRPVLIHVNGVGQEIEDSLFFSNIIDFSELLYR